MKFALTLIATLVVFNVIVEAVPFEKVLDNHFHKIIKNISSAGTKEAKAAEVTKTLKFLTGILNLLNEESKTLDQDKKPVQESSKKEKIELDDDDDEITEIKEEPTKKQEIKPDVMKKIEKAEPMDNEIEHSHKEELKKDLNVNYMKSVPLKKSDQVEILDAITPPKTAEARNLRNKKMFQKLFGTLPKVYSDLGYGVKKPMAEFGGLLKKSGAKDETKETTFKQNYGDEISRRRIQIFIRPKRIFAEKKEEDHPTKKIFLSEADAMKPLKYTFSDGTPMFIPRPKDQRPSPCNRLASFNFKNVPMFGNHYPQRPRKTFLSSENQQELPKALFMITRTVPAKTSENHEGEGIRGFFDKIFKKNEEKKIEAPVQKTKYLRLNELLKKLQDKNGSDNTKTIYQKERIIDPNNKSIITKETVISFTINKEQ